MSKGTIQIGRRSFEAGNLDKVIFSEGGITQGDLLDYHRRIADTMLPHMRDRPLTLQRFPDGIDAAGFYQKEAPDYLPEWIKRVSISVGSNGADQAQVLCQDKATLAYLIDQGCITFHTWLSRADKLNHPNCLIFDLDPPDDDFDPIRVGARTLRDLLAELALSAYVRPPAHAVCMLSCRSTAVPISILYPGTRSLA